MATDDRQLGKESQKGKIVKPIILTNDATSRSIAVYIFPCCLRDELEGKVLSTAYMARYYATM